MGVWKKISSFIKPNAGFVLLVFLFLFGIIFQQLSRAYFLFRHLDKAQGIDLSTILRAFAIGFRFDASTISYAILPLVFFLLPIFDPKKYSLARRIFKFYFAIVLFFLALIAIVDAEYFAQFNSHLSLWALEYIDQPAIVLYMIFKGYNIFLVIIALASLSAIILLLVKYLFRFMIMRFPQASWGRGSFIFLLTGFLLFLGMRGNIGLAPIDWGTAYFSKNHFANQLVLNGTFTLFKTIQEVRSEKFSIDSFVRYKHGKALENVHSLMICERDSLIDAETLKRKTYPKKNREDEKLNVVIIMLESFSANYISCLLGPEGVTPCFDSIASANILFSRLYSTGTRTNRGIVSVLFGYPSQPTRSILKRYSAKKPYMSIAESLSPFGYNTLFLYGGDLGFDNLGGALRDAGFTKVIGLESFNKSQMVGKWGVPDEIAFDRFFREINRIEEPFTATMLTLTSHEPFDLPNVNKSNFAGEATEEKYLYSIHYTDSCLGVFFDRARNEDWFDRTVFVLCADHGHYLHPQNDLDARLFHIAGAIIARKDILPFTGKYENIVSQTDILPTIYDLIGIEVVHSSWGKSAFDSIASRFALMNDGSKIGFLFDTIFVVDNVSAEKVYFFRVPDDKSQIAIDEMDSSLNKILEFSRSLTQISVELLRN